MESEFIYNTNLSFVYIFYLVVLGIMIELGFRSGKRRPGDGPVESLLELIPTSLLGLLALLLGFTFSMSLSRFDRRKEVMVRETNAIETAWLRAGVLQPSQIQAARTALFRYLDHRTRFLEEVQDPSKVPAYEKENQRLQNEIWKIVEAESQRDRTPITALFVNSVNEMIDLSTERLFASQDHVPQVTSTFIFAMAAASVFTLARVYGTRKHRRIPLWILAVVLSTVLILIKDLDRPAHGLVTINPQLMLDLKESLSANRNLR